MKLETGWTPTVQAYAVAAVATMQADVALAAANGNLHVASVFSFLLRSPFEEAVIHVFGFALLVRRPRIRGHMPHLSGATAAIDATEATAAPDAPLRLRLRGKQTPPPGVGVFMWGIKYIYIYTIGYGLLLKETSLLMK